MTDSAIIKTSKIIYPQIYAYTIPSLPDDNGWIKIGYTEREDVNSRIKEQTHTAAVNLIYSKLWSEPAKYKNKDEWFNDKQLHAYLRKFKKVEQRPKSEWFYYDGTPEKAHLDFNDFIGNNLDQAKMNFDYQLRDEQLDAVNTTLNYARQHNNGEFLWNAKPRFGKTLATYDLARKLDAVNVLVVTNRPAIANSWFDDFEEFIAWQTDYKFVSTSDSLKNRPVLKREEFIKLLDSDIDYRQIAFISLQDLKGAIAFGGSHDKLSWVKKLHWDLLVIDEAHEGVDTFKTDIAFDNIDRDFTLNLSGTPFKAVASGKFSDDQIYNWSYADEQEAKVTWPDTRANNPYEKLPKLNLFSYQIGQMITDEVNEGARIDGKNIDYAFDLNEFFETKDNGKFLHEADVKKWLDTLTHNEKYPFSTKELRAELKHTFWILNRVASAKALKKLLEEHPVFENYKVVLAAGDGKTNDDQIINESSFKRVQDAIKSNDKTITLSVGQLTTGVTIPEWSGVMMLSNMKSPSLYMQAAFRAQNTWEFQVNGERHQKENAYVFDFAPERTLIIYDEFANNLSRKTANGGGTSDNRKENIQQLLNFFPVIAEDSEGRMVELDVNQVLTIPKSIKAQEVVKRGFMSNLLFQNISGIFASAGAREILEQLNPVDQGKTTPRQTDEQIDTQGVHVDGDGKAEVNSDIVVANTQAKFGEKVYADIVESAQSAVYEEPAKLSETIATAFKQNTQEVVKALASENGVSVKHAEQILEQNTNAIAREIETIQKHADIKQAEAEVELNKQVKIAESRHDTVAVEQAKSDFENTKQKNTEVFQKNLAVTVETKSKELTQLSTEEILKQAEEKKKNTVEDDVRARLRGFARTIPSFLMAYGQPETTLTTFDATIKDNVFKEVTGITLAQFRTLRDHYQFFDEVVFNESVQEFLRKRQELANYFDESQDEDIFDYIPPQQTNQIYTPKKVVKMMIDKLQEESPEDFKDPNKTFADLYVKSGLYITEIVKRLYVGLENQIPDSDERLKHILEHQVYGFAPTEIIYKIARNFIFGFDTKASNIDDSHIVYLDTTPYAKGEAKMSFEDKCDELVGGNDDEV